RDALIFDAFLFFKMLSASLASLVTLLFFHHAHIVANTVNTLDTAISTCSDSNGNALMPLITKTLLIKAYTKTTVLIINPLSMLYLLTRKYTEQVRKYLL